MTQNSASNIYIGLDIGSSKIACVVGLKEDNSPVPSIIGIGAAPAAGVRKGVIVDVEDTVSSISAALDEAQRMAGVPLAHATIGINGSHVTTLSSQGIIAVGGGREITLDDVERVEEAAAIVQLPPNREIIHVFARSYSIDGQEYIKDPISMSGMRLEVDTRLVTGSTPALRNLARTVYQAGLTVDSQVVNAVAAATALVDKRQRELGCVLMDFGSGTTSLAIYEEGELLHTSVIPVGSGHITNDLAIGLRTDIETAETVKLEHVEALPKAKDQKGGFSIKELSGELISVSRQEINEIARARLEEILELVQQEIVKVKPDNMLPGGVVVTGGGANLPGLEEFVKNSLRLPASIAKPKGFSGIVDRISDPAYTVAVGLMLENMHAGVERNFMQESLSSAKHFLQSLWSRFVHK